MMNVEAINLQSPVQFKSGNSADQVSVARKKAVDSGQSDKSAKQQVQPEELLSQINALTENGTYSVRFERNKLSDDLVVKIVNQQDGEVIRQMPAEEVLKMKASLAELRGNIVSTES